MTSDQYALIGAIKMNDQETLTRLRIIDAGGDDCTTVTTQSDGVCMAVFWDKLPATAESIVNQAGYTVLESTSVFEETIGTHSYVWFKGEQSCQK